MQKLDDIKNHVNPEMYIVEIINSASLDNIKDDFDQISKVLIENDMISNGTEWFVEFLKSYMRRLYFNNSISKAAQWHREIFDEEINIDNN